MKRSEFKNKIKPIIEECIKEMLFEEGILSGIISEVIKGTKNNVVYESKHNETEINKEKERITEERKERKEIKRKSSDSRKKLLDAIGKDAFNGVNLFEGTEPMRGGAAKDGAAPQSPLANMAPNDPGIDISNIPGVNVWKHLIKE